MKSSSGDEPRAYTDSEAGVRQRTNVGRTAALVTLAILILGLVLAVPQIEKLKRILGSGDLRVTDTTEVLSENADGTCTWIVSFTIENVSGGVLTLASVGSSVKAGSLLEGRFERSESGLDTRELEPDATANGFATFDYEGCPATIDDLSHGGVFVTYSLINTTTGAPTSVRTKLVAR